jgi:hypothetical protein
MPQSDQDIVQNFQNGVIPVDVTEEYIGTIMQLFLSEYGIIHSSLEDWVKLIPFVGLVRLLNLVLLKSYIPGLWIRLIYNITMALSAISPFGSIPIITLTEDEESMFLGKVDSDPEWSHKFFISAIVRLTKSSRQHLMNVSDLSEIDWPPAILCLFPLVVEHNESGVWYILVNEDVDRKYFREVSVLGEPKAGSDTILLQQNDCHQICGNRSIWGNPIISG